jgi:hypothetical protein
MTREEFFAKFVAVLEARLGDKPVPDYRANVDALKQAGVAGLAVFAQPLLYDLPAAPGATTGACDYDIEGQPFCMENVTEGECLNLGGTFRESGTCPVSNKW